MQLSSTVFDVSQLEKLRAEILRLSERLHECYDLLCTDLALVHDKWQDDHYDSFEQDFKTTKERVFEISEKYKNWADSYLPPIIEKTKEYEAKRDTLNRRF